MDYYNSKVFLSWFISISSLMGVMEYSSADTGGGVSMEYCMGKLLPCQPYLKSSSSPPESCCTPLESMVDDGGGGGDCLCRIFSDSALLKSFNLTQDDALKLPKACGLDPDISSCPNATSSSTPSNTTSSSTPSNSPSSSSDDDTNAAYGITYFEGNSFIGLLVAFFCFSILYH